MRIMVTGATGFVGKNLVKLLKSQGHQLVILSRNVAKAAIECGSDCLFYEWKAPYQEAPIEAFSQVDGIINLMGENIASARWSDQQKRKIYDSRVEGTKNLLKPLQDSGNKIKFLISTSAIGIYGPKKNEEIDETTETVNSDFLSKVCQDWENVLEQFSCFERKVIMRVGVVLGHGGMLDKLLPIFKLGLGGPVLPGSQYMSWIHVEDLVRLYAEVAQNDQYQGIVNATAPTPVTNKEFSFTLGKVLFRPAFFFVPGVALELAMGEMSCLVLDSQKIFPRVAQGRQFHFKYPTIEGAIRQILKK